MYTGCKLKENKEDKIIKMHTFLPSKSALTTEKTSQWLFPFLRRRKNWSSQNVTRIVFKVMPGYINSWWLWSHWIHTCNFTHRFTIKLHRCSACTETYLLSIHGTRSYIHCRWIGLGRQQQQFRGLIVSTDYCFDHKRNQELATLVSRCYRHQQNVSFNHGSTARDCSGLCTLVHLPFYWLRAFI